MSSFKMQMYKYSVSMQEEKLRATCLSPGGLGRAARLETPGMSSWDGLNKGLIFFFLILLPSVSSLFKEK